MRLLRIYLRHPRHVKTQEITADDFVLIRFSAKKTEVLSVGQVKEKETFT
jgi:hypothetical protein